MKCQALVLGADIVGVCSALHLQAAGQNVGWLDRDEPGSNTRRLLAEMITGAPTLIDPASYSPARFR